MGRPRYKPDLEKVETYAALQLSTREMAACLGIGESTFFQEQKRNKKFRDAIDRGRAKAVAQCAQMVLKHAVDKTDDNGKILRAGDPRLALEYLKIHSQQWSQRPQTVNHTGTVQQQVTVDGKVVHNVELSKEAAVRMAKAFVEIHGEAS